ncbi:MAG: hypothetical protein LW717_18385 [Chloroflexaceae bacterium]|jgi:hypothetical protein|nr:hypothetical protein [Chloroflexaceae bacterium]MCE2853135.1 hypothetical protein [Chloroflexaceae bacterium]
MMFKQAYVQGVSTRKVAALAHAIGIDGLDKSTCACLIGNLRQHGIEYIGLNVSTNNPRAQLPSASA